MSKNEIFKNETNLDKNFVLFLFIIITVVYNNNVLNF